MTLVNLLDRVPAQAGEQRNILNSSYAAKLHDESLERFCVMLFWLGEFKRRLLDGTASLAFQTRNVYRQLDLSAANWQSLENASGLAGTNDLA